MKYEAGPELDKLIAEHVFKDKWDESRCRVCGWPFKPEPVTCYPNDCSLRPLPKRRADQPGEFSTNIIAAWSLVQFLKGKGLSVRITQFSGGMVRVEIAAFGQLWTDLYVDGETFPLALCRAALKLEGIE